MPSRASAQEDPLVAQAIVAADGGALCTGGLMGAGGAKLVPTRSARS